MLNAEFGVYIHGSSQFMFKRAARVEEGVEITLVIKIASQLYNRKRKTSRHIQLTLSKHIVNANKTSSSPNQVTK